tara:strand:- start:163 stop:354 length:192 start_codon:yes stop_codon:yes gene_type:complete
MTIQSINAYTPSRGADPRLDRTWATKAEVEKLENQIVNLRERIAGLEKDFTYLYKHHVEKNDG